MAHISIGNSYSRVTGLTVKQEKELREILSYTVGGRNAYFSKYGPRRQSLLAKRGEFPTGLLDRVYDYLVEFSVSHTSGRPRYPRASYASWHPLSLPIKPYDAQIHAINAVKQYHRGILSMPTGTGKSFVIAMIIDCLRVKTLVIVPTLEIKKQLTKTLSELFHYSDKKHITIENIDSRNLKNAKNYDCLIIDEAHHSASKTYRKLNKTAWNNIYYRYFLSATAFRNDPEEQILFESIAGEIIYKLSYRDAIKDSYIVPVEAYYLECPKQETDAFTYAEVYSNLVVHNNPRNKIICNLLERLKNNSVYTLCLVKEVAHGKILSKLTGIPFVNGEDEASREYIRQFNEGKIRSLIGTEGIIGEGIDTKPCEYVVIAGLGKAKSSFMQKCGRGVRKYPGKESCKVILFRDKSHKFLTRHFNEQRKILIDEYGVKPVKLEI